MTRVAITQGNEQFLSRWSARWLSSGCHSLDPRY